MSRKGRGPQSEKRARGGVKLLLSACLCAFVGITGAQAQESEDSSANYFRRTKEYVDFGEKWKKLLQWQMSLAGRTYESDRESAHLGLWGAKFESAFHFSDYLQMDVDADVVLGVGRSQALYQDFLPSNNFRLRQAITTLHTRDYGVFFSAGVLGCIYDAPQLRSCVAFPGIQQSITLGGDPIRLRFAAQQATPTSETRFSEATEIEPTPLYNTEFVELRLRPLENVLLSAWGAHYRFKDLPRIVAYRSFLVGNLEVTGGGAESSIFTTEFDGYIGTGQIEWDLNFVEVEMGQQWVYNAKAPERQNLGQMVWGKGKFSGARHEWTPSFYYFVTESDVGPAIYAASRYGRNNRKGFSLGLDLKFREEGFKLKALYSKADVILSSMTQDDQQVFSLEFETDLQRIF